jgi:hypothetical protein
MKENIYCFIKQPRLSFPSCNHFQIGGGGVDKQRSMVELRSTKIHPEVGNEWKKKRTLGFLSHFVTERPDWAYFRLLGDCFLWSGFLKIRKQPKCLGYFFPRQTLHINFDKIMGWATFWAIKKYHLVTLSRRLISAWKKGSKVWLSGSTVACLSLIWATDRISPKASLRKEGGQFD